MAELTLTIQIKPTLDLKAANGIVDALNSSLKLGLKPIDPKAFSEATTAAGGLERELELLKKRLAEIEGSGQRVSKAFQFNQMIQAVQTASSALDGFTRPGLKVKTQLVFNILIAFRREMFQEKRLQRFLTSRHTLHSSLSKLEDFSDSFRKPEPFGGLC